MWRPRSNLSVTVGLRFDVPVFENTAYNNANANALTFRDENGQPGAVRQRPDAGRQHPVVAALRLQLRRRRRSEDADARRHGRVHRPAALRLDLEPAGQHRRAAGQLSQTRDEHHDAFPFSTNVDRYKPTNVTGAPAASYELNVTDNDFQFPQVWRSNLAVDRRLPGGITGTAEFIYNRDVNGIYYINANLPAAQTAFTGADTRPRWTNNRINNATGNQVTSAIVMKNQDIGRNWNLAFSASKPMWHGLSLRTAYSYGEAKNTIDPGSTAFASWNSNPTPGDPEQPGPRLLERRRRATASSCSVATPSSTSASARRRSRRSGRAAHASATPATSSRPTRTATALDERPDLHPARHARR